MGKHSFNIYRGLGSAIKRPSPPEVAKMIEEEEAKGNTVEKGFYKTLEK